VPGGDEVVLNQEPTADHRTSGEATYRVGERRGIIVKVELEILHRVRGDIDVDRERYGVSRGARGIEDLQ
jgi:hypothetical protein